jgi:photosystem II stability/assembly factor-like uncharacterized protein
MKNRLALFVLFIGTICPAIAQTKNWKPLGPFSIHKTVGSVEAPGLGVMRSLDVSLNNPNMVLMGGMGSGIWRTTDKGETWKNVTLDLPVENVKKIQIAHSNNKIVYAATTVGILKSLDNGVSWKFTNLNMLDELNAKGKAQWSDDTTLLSVSPTNPNVVIASNTDTVYKTTDGGVSWKPILEGFGAQFIEFHPTNENIVYLGGSYRKSKQLFFVYRSTNSGESFEEITKGMPDKNKLVRLHDITAAVSPAAPDKLYLTIFGEAPVRTTVKQELKNQMVGTFIESVDAGLSFQLVPQANNYRYIDEYYSLFHPYSADENKDEYDFDMKDKSFWSASFQQVGWATSFAISPTDANIMVMAASGNIISNDTGRTWNVLRKQGTYAIHGDMQCAKIVGDDIWLANDGGLQYVNMKTRLHHRVEGFSGQDLWGFSTSFKSDVMAVGVDHSGTMVYNEKLYGKDWYHYGGGDAMSATLNPFNDRYLYATPYTHYIIKLPATLRDEPISIKSPVSFGYIPNRNIEFHPNLFYTSYSINENSDHSKIKNCSVIKTEDNFKTLDTLKTFPENFYIRRLRVSFSNPDFMYVLVGNKRSMHPDEVWMTVDGGKNWSNITPDNAVAKKNGFPDIAISDEDPHKIYLGVGGFQNEVKILASKDAGKSWIDDHSADLPKNEIQTMAYQRGTNEGVYLGCYPGLFYKSSNTGTWKTVGEHLPYTPINFISLNYDKEKIRVGTYRGIWEHDLYETTAPKANIALSKRTLGVEGTDSDEEDSDQMKVYFYDNSVIKGKGAKFNWEFPGAIPATSDEENPIVNYSACKPGMYSVKLTVTDAKGRKSDFELKNYIEVKNNYPWNLREKKLEMEEHEDEDDE